MKITVLGCGALGQVWLNALANQGYQVQGWQRQQQSDFSTELTEPDGRYIQRQFITNCREFMAGSDLLLVTLKAWQVLPALNALQPILPEQLPILLLHNGMGTVQELKHLSQPLLTGITTHAAKREGKKVIHVASGETIIGPAKSCRPVHTQLASQLNAALPSVVWNHDMTFAHWQKLAVNCIINPLTAIHRCKNGELIHDLPHITGLCEEVTAVMIAQGLPISLPLLLKHVMSVIHNTAGNTSSMLQDILANQPTEIDYITGYLLAKAREQKIAAPLNAQLYACIKQLSQ